MEQQIKLAAKLYQCRDTAKRFFVEEFKEKVLPYQNLISNIAEGKGIDELKAVMLLCEDDAIKNNGWTVMLLMAAAVELTEPTPADKPLKG